ncbi:MAG TPA: hypothetical protein PKH18_02310 [Ottowia sp.]|nr:hypothetical protein [Ottowia sp.]
MHPIAGKPAPTRTRALTQGVSAWFRLVAHQKQELLAHVMQGFQIKIWLKPLDIKRKQLLFLM